MIVVGVDVDHLGKNWVSEDDCIGAWVYVPLKEGKRLDQGALGAG